jgi:hypothetical protein
LYITAATNPISGYPDFTAAAPTLLEVPVSLSDNPATIAGAICDADAPYGSCPGILGTPGVVYATNNSTGQVSRAFVDKATGDFMLTGLSPGSYSVRASAGETPVGGCFRLGFACAYSLSDPVLVSNLQRGSAIAIGLLPLHEAPQVFGIISCYYLTTLLPSCVDNPYFTAYLPAAVPPVGVIPIGAPLPAAGGLDITVEATDPQGHVFRVSPPPLPASPNTPFDIVTGEETDYVGLDPYGTVYAGLPSTNGGSYVLTIRIWIYGYVQELTEQVTISSMPGMVDPTTPFPANTVGPNPVLMEVGGEIAGTINFWNLEAPESPAAGAADVGLPPGTFGGNVVVEAFDHTGILRGVTVIEWTLAYTVPKAIAFGVIGFSNQYYGAEGGVWGMKDYGLPPDPQGYSLVVLMRGYSQNVTTPSPVSLSVGETSIVNVKMIRGGAMVVTVGSYDNRPGSLGIQAPQPWLFLGLSIPMKARVYFYDWQGNTVGYDESSIAIGPGVTNNALTDVFSGQDYSLQNIVFYGDVPTYIGNGNYTIKAFTLGYIQPRIASVEDSFAGLALAFIPLFIGNEIDVTVPIFADADLLGTVPEPANSVAQVYDVTDGNVLAGAMNDLIATGAPALDFPVYGFGGTVLGGGLEGQGHFFYVSPSGVRYFDYGLNAQIHEGTTYSAVIPEFGFTAHFMQLYAPPTVTFNDLYLETGVVVEAIQMAEVIQGVGPISGVGGWVAGMSSVSALPLSWVQVAASNGSISRMTSTVDGDYDGLEALFLPAGNYLISFSVPFYYTQTTTSFQVNWGGTYSLLPPLQLLCPIAEPSACSAVPSQSASTAPSLNSLNLLTTRNTTATQAIPDIACQIDNLRHSGSKVQPAATARV